MKSVTVKSQDGKLLLKIIHRDRGVYEMVRNTHHCSELSIEVRDKQNKKVFFPK
jgi:hypothetical protein